ncbi:MAG TPA: DMT family transporter, partial [Gammaproteobacteria bacterium]|nr:DMT family transporter [Gammaproteobacteria bacterium]
VYAAAAATIVMWGGTPIANKIALSTIDPATAGMLRSLIAGVIAGVLALGWRLPFPAGTGPRSLLALSGIGNFAIWPLLLSLGLGMTTASHAALLIAMIPAFTGLLAAIIDRAWPRLGWWAGVLVAGVGTFFLIGSRADPALEAETGATVIGDLVILLGVMVCAGGYVAGGKLSPIIGTWATSFWGLGLAAIVLAPIVGALAGRTDWAAVDASSWFAIAYMAVLGSLVGYVLWFWALGHGGIARISSWQMGQPVISVVFAAIVLGEAVTLPLVIAGAAIVAGTALTQLQRRSNAVPSSTSGRAA